MFVFSMFFIFRKKNEDIMYRMTLFPDPILTVSPANSTIKSGSSLNLTCKGPIKNETYLYQFKCDNQIVQRFSSNDTFSISSVATKDSCSYICQVKTNSVTSETHTHDVTILGRFFDFLILYCKTFYTYLSIYLYATF